MKSLFLGFAKLGTAYYVVSLLKIPSVQSRENQSPHEEDVVPPLSPKTVLFNRKSVVLESFSEDVYDRVTFFVIYRKLLGYLLIITSLRGFLSPDVALTPFPSEKIEWWVTLEK